MSGLVNKGFNLSIVDPPYFNGPGNLGYYGSRVSPIGVSRGAYRVPNWKIPDNKYFEELKRVSKNQIIWGINYFPIQNPGPGRIIWDKCNDSSSFSDCEIAYSSFHKTVRLFPYMWNGMLQGKSITEGRLQQGNKKLNEKRIHPTQKPVNLYLWLLQKYAKTGDIIFDSHVGSGSICIACHKLGFKMIGTEIDESVLEDTVKRIENHLEQLDLFDKVGNGCTG